MNTREIKETIGRYFEGETTLDEERRLREYFLKEDVPVELAGYKRMFSLFGEERQTGISDTAFSEKLDAKLQAGEGKTIPMVSLRSKRIYYASLAATLLLLIGIAAAIVWNMNLDRKEFAAKQLAYEQAREALMIVSSNMNSGIAQVQYLRAFDKGMEKIRMFSRFYEYQTLIVQPERNQPLSTKTHP